MKIKAFSRFLSTTFFTCETLVPLPFKQKGENKDEKYPKMSKKIY